MFESAELGHEIDKETYDKEVPALRQALSFVPVTVLTAIIVPMILAPQGQGLELSWHNPQLVGAIAAVIVCAMTRHQLLTILVGLLVFLGWQYGLR